MAADGQVRERVYRELKRRLIEGELALDQHLDLRALSAALDASPTPVKEALVRLTGERLVVAKEKGFQVARWSAAQLAALYEWRLQLVLIALHGGPRLNIPSPDQTQDFRWRVRRLFEACESDAGEEHHVAASNADDRLSYARMVEPELWADADEELVELTVALQADQMSTRVAPLRRYFDRRVEAAQAIRDRAIIRSHPNGG